jgi:hypothetical protein
VNSIQVHSLPRRRSGTLLGATPLLCPLRASPVAHWSVSSLCSLFGRQVSQSGTTVAITNFVPGFFFANFLIALIWAPLKVGE